MLHLESDYNTGAHPDVIKMLTETNAEALSGYGTDKYSEAARTKIRAACKCPDAEIVFISGGTQTNAVAIALSLADYEGVIAARTGHVSLHEAGAIEYTGHKVIELPGTDGKLYADTVREYCEVFYADENRSMMVFPGMVYVSYPTEYGTLYSKAELEAIAAVCRDYNMKLFLDGARLGYGLMSRESDLTLPDIARICDLFYIGGTKLGALCGEALVFTKNNMPPHADGSIKRRGAMMSKSRVLGVQFDALFTNDLYFRIGRHSVELAEKMRDVFARHGFKFLLQSPTNQQFPIIENGLLAKLREKVTVGFWEKYDDTHSVIRCATCWSTTEADIAELDRILGEITS